MKKNFTLIAAVTILLALPTVSCSKEKKSVSQTASDGSIVLTKVTADPKNKKAVQYDKKADGFNGITVIDGSLITTQHPVNINLNDYANSEIAISFSCDIKIDNPEDAETDILWMINDYDAGFPELARQKVKTGEWTHMKGETSCVIGANKLLHISGSGLPKRQMKFFLKNFKVKIQTSESLNGQIIPWMEAPALKNRYKDYFDIGIACVYRGELDDPKTVEGLSHHADTFTTGNEFKPDFLFAWQPPRAGQLKDFIAEDGKTYRVPTNVPKYKDMDTILQIAKDNNLKMRGHVLVWHSQTPKWFFKKDFEAGNDYVGKAEMTARQEWYIKSVLEHVREWEEKNNNGQHIVKVWDVVNEAAADGATDTKWLREDSDWFRIYGDETFIVNAFRYANKYAPKDVQLAYNDYGTYSGSSQDKGGKTNAVLKIIDAIQACSDARIDVLGMQSHVSVDYPSVTGSESYETALQKFLAKGIDVQVTELDIANGSHKYSPITLKQKYKDYYTLFVKYAKKAGNEPGISNVTVWGIVDEGTWLNGMEQYKGNTQFPLLFDGRNNAKGIKTKPAFFGAYEAIDGN